MDVSAARCPYCGSTELEVFEPGKFAGDGLESPETSLWCAQCLHHQFPGTSAPHPVLEVSPPLSLAGYAETTSRWQAVKTWLAAAAARWTSWFAGKPISRAQVEDSAPPSPEMDATPPRPRLRA